MNQPAATPPSSYLRYLPGVFARADDGFLAQYLLIFEKLLTGLDDSTLDGRKGIQELLAAGVVGNLFYSRFSFLFAPDDTSFMPPISGLPDQGAAILARFNTYIGVPAPGNALGGQISPPLLPGDTQSAFNAWLADFLAWLAGWVELALDSSWSLDKKRSVIAQSMALYRLRGTPQGLGMLLNLLLDLPLQISCIPATGIIPVYGTLSVDVANPERLPIKLTDTADSSSFVLRCRYQPTMPVVSGYAPWLFVVTVSLSSQDGTKRVPDAIGAQQIEALLARLRTVLDAVRPAATRYQVQLVGFSALRAKPIYRPALNVNAILGT